MSRTMQIWVNGEHFIVRDDDVDELLEIGAQADHPDQAWEDAYEWLVARE